ncbi:hypothetical protein [Bacillus sp. ISL-39]|uniref:hypothetical protein n=1 Tax=Bacillus sp. ISL-39 TaxID=2819124 RepID=UPI001BE5A051|nr:hypothetical protein [Bacillus sp. ISL-39]MBT2637977.1 hypothetical protein [Bacillus sp. ISL-39]
MPPETPPFRGSWTARRATPTTPRTEGHIQSPERRKKKAANPLILQPPKVKGIDLLHSAPKKQLFRAKQEKEPNDPEESEFEEKSADSIVKEDLIDVFLDEESSDHIISKEESSEYLYYKEESSQEFSLNEESSEQNYTEENYEQEIGNETDLLNRKSYEYPLLGSMKEMPDETESSNESDATPNSFESLEKLHCRPGERTQDIKVKLPVNLAHVNLEVDIFDVFTIIKPIASVTTVEWSIHSIDMDIILPTRNFFSKGILLLDLEYVEKADDHETGTLHSLKIHVPWSKIVKVEWVLPPELSCNQSKEYMFTENDGNDPSFHREFSERLVDKLDFQLTNLSCTWNEQLLENEKLLIQGSANMQIDIYQKQCVDLRDLVSSQ